jgi:hypothetical protein
MKTASTVLVVMLCALSSIAGCVITPHPEYVSRKGATSREADLVVPAAHGTYRIRSVLDGEVITGPKAAAEQYVGVDDDRGRAPQRWKLIPAGARKFQLQVSDVGYCLADHGSGVLEEVCNAQDRDQQWLIVQHQGHYEIMFRDSEKCLGVGGRGKLVDLECHGTVDQLWDFVPVSGP